MRHRLSKSPFITPCLSIACIAYSLQVGTKRQLAPKSGDINVLYSFMGNINIFLSIICYPCFVQKSLQLRLHQRLFDIRCLAPGHKYQIQILRGVDVKLTYALSDKPARAVALDRVAYLLAGGDAESGVAVAVIFDDIQHHQTAHIALAAAVRADKLLVFVYCF